MRLPKPPPTTARVKTIPAPVGGWNTRDPLEAMAITDAVKLDNLLPAPGGVVMREGFEEHVTGIAGPVTSLMEYAPPSGSNTLFAANAANIYDVTTPGVVATAVQAGLSNGFWQHTMMASAAGSFLWCCNGEDYARVYNGSVWATASVTSSSVDLTAAQISNVTMHKERLWLVKKNSTDVYYLPPASITGVATKFGLGSFFKAGGHVSALATWSRDGGAGQDDYLVAISSRGECVVYQGTDPNSADTWALVGVFSIPEPIGARCVKKEGADLVVLTTRGVVPLSLIIGIASAGQINKAISDKITPSFEDAGRLYSQLAGWQLVDLPKRSLFIVNIPTSSATAMQFVMQAQTGSWCRFTGIDAGCFSLLDEDLYIGLLDGRIVKYGEVYTDDEMGVKSAMQTAFTDFAAPGEKIFELVRASMQAPDGLVTQFSVKTDFDVTDTELQVVPFDETGVAWDVADWDTANWGASIVATSDWQAPDVAGPGHVGSLAVALQSDTAIKFNTFDVMFQQGAAL